MRQTAILGLGSLMACCSMSAQIGLSGKTPQGPVNCQSPAKVDVIGSVIQADPNSFVLDLCLPTQDCSAPIRAEFSATASGFAGFQRYLRPGAFIRVNLGIERRDGGCAQQMSVESVASWLGARNPSGRGDELYFAAAIDVLKLPGSIGFDAKPCVDGNGTLNLAVDKTRVTLRTGAAQKFAAKEVAQWTARLVSAGACNSPRGWSYWVAGPPGF